MSANLLRPGLYDTLITDDLAGQLESVGDDLVVERMPIDAGESHIYLARHVSKELSELLRLMERDGWPGVRAQAHRCNLLLSQLFEGEDRSAPSIKDPPMLL